MKTYFVYITTNPGRTVLYTGMTNNLTRRLSEHHQNRGSSNKFTGKYFCYNLLYYEEFHEVLDAIRREKKERLIAKMNPNWEFLNHHFL